jgi:hypothetical protein
MFCLKPDMYLHFWFGSVISSCIRDVDCSGSWVASTLMRLHLSDVACYVNVVFVL